MFVTLHLSQNPWRVYLQQCLNDPGLLCLPETSHRLRDFLGNGPLPSAPKPLDFVKTRESRHPGASKVATIDAGPLKPEGAPEVARAAAALAAAAKTCGGTELQAADQVSVVRNILKDEQVTVSLVELLEAIPQVVGDSKVEAIGGCERLLAGYAATRHAGQNHLATTNGMRGLVKVVSK